MDFGILPPEVNSGRMYSGPGPGPVLAGAMAWAGLAAEWELAAGSYRSVIADLATGWAGPSAAAMATAVTPYVTWMQGAAAVAEQTAMQARSAAAAFETAFAMTVPPPVIAVNRSLLLSLIATNFFGQNTAAIAATEASYAQMWAQDATAMYGYAAAAARATTLTPFTAPPEATNPVGALDQAAAIGRTVGSSLATNTQQTLTKLSSTLHATTPPAAEAMLSQSGPLGGSLSTSELPASTALGLTLIPLHLGLDLFGAVVLDGLGVFAIDAPGAAGSTLLKEMLAAGEIPYVLASASSPCAAPMAAGLGQAIPVSGLSVPKAWTTAAAGGPATGPRPTDDSRTAHPMPASTPRGSLNELAMAGAAGLGVTAGISDDRPAVAAPAARRLKAPRAPGDSPLEIAAEFRELTSLHDAGILTGEEFVKERDRLFGS